MTQLSNTASSCAAQWKMWLIKVFSVMCFTAICAAAEPQDAITAVTINSPTDSSTELMETSTVYEPPVPSLQLQSTWLDVFPSEKVEFSCQISNSADWDIIWHINTAPVPDADPNLSVSADKSVLTVIAATQMYSGSYSCKGHHKTKGVPTQSSNSLEVKVYANKPKLTVSRSPNFDKMFPGESVTFTCTVDASSGWEYLWYHNGTETSISPNYVINSIVHSSSGQYTCKAKRGKSPFFTEESGTSLQVSDPPTPSLMVLSPWLDVFENETLAFNCKVDDSSWTYTWYRNQQKVTEGDGSFLNISVVTQADRGAYACKAHLESRSVSSGFSNTADVTVYDHTPKPTMSKAPDFNPMYVGETVIFTCKVDMSSGWNYHWYKDGHNLPHDSSNSISIPLSLSDGGSYSCKATRGETTSTSHSAEIKQAVHEIPVPSLKKRTQWLDVFPTESVTLNCGMEGSSDWTYTWYKGGQEVQPDNTVTFDKNRATISITSASAKHAGEYSCRGHLHDRSVNSSSSSELSLTVYDTKPIVTLMKDPEYDVMHTEDSVTFTCHINVSSGWEYLWYKDGTPLAESGKNYSIRTVEMTNIGSYTCQVKRKMNTVFQSDQSQAIRLNIEKRPQANIILLTGWSEVFATDSLVLKCEVQESQDMWNYTWFKEELLINMPHSERHTVTPQDDPEQSRYTCRGSRSGRPSYSKTSDSFKTKNLLLKRRVLLSISGCLFFGLIVVFLGCIFLKVFRKPADVEDKLEEDLFLTMAQLKDRGDAPCPLVEYITDAELNAPSKEADENGTISETTPLPISTQEDQAVMENHGAEENNGGLVSFKQ
ncbi:carcinoembryonic antigen-related cell adhesion molecule 5-like isoform X2 [Toxotes jaculatrix]|uniref:carcinoembryonic antigen-related cell adhesion molecule 5-like isoform X2 n=1 Tax=Toxotes jaculatrix TaxID=941984 RepID=UPI001B3AA403|nr:carcinoembryonic antigen-related cell adhesion molecule 5-like isoform X2 [Toxotes jaculatrix]